MPCLQISEYGFSISIFLGNFSKRVMRVLGLLGKDMLTVMKGADGEGWKGFGARGEERLVEIYWKFNCLLNLSQGQV